MKSILLQVEVEAGLGWDTGLFRVFVIMLALLGAVVLLVWALGRVRSGSDGDSDNAIERLRVRWTRGEISDEKLDERAFPPPEPAMNVRADVPPGEPSGTPSETGHLLISRVV